MVFRVLCLHDQLLNSRTLLENTLGPRCSFVTQYIDSKRSSHPIAASQKQQPPYYPAQRICLRLGRQMHTHTRTHTLRALSNLGHLSVPLPPRWQRRHGVTLLCAGHYSHLPITMSLNEHWDPYSDRHTPLSGQRGDTFSLYEYKQDVFSLWNGKMQLWTLIKQNETCWDTNYASNLQKTLNMNAIFVFSVGVAQTVKDVLCNKFWCIGLMFFICWNPQYEL